MRLLPTTCALLLAAAMVHAQSADPEALLREGVALRRAHRDAEALARFEAAYRVVHSPRALAQIGLAEQALGRWVEAESHVSEALGAAGDPWIGANAPSLRAALGVIGQHLGSLWVDGVEGAELFVDGQRVATLPMGTAVRRVAGSVVVEVRAQGSETVRRPLVVPPGGEAREVVRMARAASPEPVRDRAATETIAVRTVPLDERPNPLPRRLAWVALAGSAVGLGVGIGALAVREGAATTYNADRSCPGRLSASSQPAGCTSLLDATSTWELAGTIALVAGGALAVTSLVLFVTAPSNERSVERRALVSCGVTLGAWGASCTGRF